MPVTRLITPYFLKAFHCTVAQKLLTNLKICATEDVGFWNSRASFNLLGFSIFGWTFTNILSIIRRVGLRQFPASRGGAMEDLRLQEFLDFLQSLKNYEKEGVPKGAGTDTKEGFDLQRMERLIQLLGNPLSRYPVVHIAGTKGKGSTSAIIGNILREAGYSVGVYTSPHLQTIRERIVCGRKDDIISVEDLQNMFQDARDILNNALQTEHLPVTHFEVLTALAFKYFAQQGVDIAVVEAGLGGARDATNVIHGQGLAVAVITTIGKEHMDALGGSVENIAIAKSGIIKQGRPIVLGGPFEPQIEYILRKRAASMDAPVISAFGPGIHSKITRLDSTDNQPYQYVHISVKLDQNDSHMKIELFDVRLRMVGYHQLQNAVTAICTALCLRSQGWKISDDSIRGGLECTSLCGRFQVLTSVQVQMLGMGGATVILDGAHTQASAKALATTIRMVYPDKPLAFVIAMANDKDHSAFADQLISGTLPRVTVFTEVGVAGGNARKTPAASLLRTWIEVAKEHTLSVMDWSKKKNDNTPIDFSDQDSQVLFAEELGSVKAAVKKAGQLLKLVVSNESSGIICVTGSLHVVSAVMSCLCDKPV